MNPKFLIVDAGVRYWEDALVNGVEDTDGSLIPFRHGEMWRPVIDLSTGAIVDWPKGTTADVHYKVCDAGEYWLADEVGRKIAKWRGDYVPNQILCVNDNGYGDYIIFEVSADGVIEGWHQPDINPEDWNKLEALAK